MAQPRPPRRHSSSASSHLAAPVVERAAGESCETPVSTIQRPALERHPLRASRWRPRTGAPCPARVRRDRLVHPPAAHPTWSCSAWNAMSTRSAGLERPPARRLSARAEARERAEEESRRRSHRRRHRDLCTPWRRAPLSKLADDADQVVGPVPPERAVHAGLVHRSVHRRDQPPAVRRSRGHSRAPLQRDREDRPAVVIGVLPIRFTRPGALARPWDGWQSSWQIANLRVSRTTSCARRTTSLGGNVGFSRAATGGPRLPARAVGGPCPTGAGRGPRRHPPGGSRRHDGHLGPPLARRHPRAASAPTCPAPPSERPPPVPERR